MLRLDAVRQDDLPNLHTLATGIDRDRDRETAIAGLTLPWTSGVVEGHSNWIEMLKRQMFGRAGFRPPPQTGLYVLIASLDRTSRELDGVTFGGCEKFSPQPPTKRPRRTTTTLFSNSAT
ncbi:hypothetical protein [Streptomyces sp. NPDC008141]|uniref:hypothetical protein n=1 Tax=Streptomyces sp. NPDC008141 TaxID=3364815 RepID=UPI0036EFA57C